MTATAKQIDALLATGEVGNTFVDPDPAHQPFSRANAAALIESQRECVVCGNGMIVLPWADVVPVADRIALDADSGGTKKRVTIHRGCLLEVSAGAAIAQAISPYARVCKWDIDGREAIAEAKSPYDGEWVPICQRHLDGHELLQTRALA